jgi:8-oxo-dGTP pyrophosphatase MutT (NUDIX family)
MAGGREPVERLAAGVVLACPGKDGPRYLLLRNARHGTWGFAKGHTEPGETPRQAALRETLEETGIRLQDLHPGFEHQVEYTFQAATGPVRKRVVYFLATVPEPHHTLSPEHDDGGWYSLHNALERAGHEQTRELLRLAHAVLSP